MSVNQWQSLSHTEQCQNDIFLILSSHIWSMGGPSLTLSLLAAKVINFVRKQKENDRIKTIKHFRVIKQDIFPLAVTHPDCLMFQYRVSQAKTN